MYHNGYGEVLFRGRKMRAHRVAWERVNGPIPDGLVIDHVCRERSCVNPDHLRAVSRRVNALENSLGPSALNHRKTVCACGTPLAVYDATTGYRRCPSCRKAYMTEYRNRPHARAAKRAADRRYQATVNKTSTAKEKAG